LLKLDAECCLCNNELALDNNDLGKRQNWQRWRPVPKERPFADALHVALTEEDPVTKVRKLRKIADKLVSAAEAGEAWAIKEIMDRIDGKPFKAQRSMQTVDHSVTHHSEPISETTEWIRGVLRARERARLRI